VNGAVVLAAALALLPGSTGDRLYELGLFGDAATEYLRELHAGVADSELVRIKLGFSLAAAGETERAAAELRMAVEGGGGTVAALSALAGMFAGQGRYERARGELADLAAFVPEHGRNAIGLRLAWLELLCSDLPAARLRYIAFGRPDLAARLERSPPRRSPELAIALSSLLPGAGEFYAGRAGRGLLSLVVTGAGAAGTWYAARSGDWVSAGIVFSIFFLRFYQGSRANAADQVDAFNRAALENYVARLAADADAEPDWFGPAEQATGLRWVRP
jgi:hypothetical protein